LACVYVYILLPSLLRLLQPKRVPEAQRSGIVIIGVIPGDRLYVHLGPVELAGEVVRVGRDAAGGDDLSGPGDVAAGIIIVEEARAAVIVDIGQAAQGYE
jgi:hypothetical protein